MESSWRLSVAGYELTVERRFVDFVFKNGTIENFTLKIHRPFFHFEILEIESMVYRKSK
jgi:hypothetical protein